MGGFFGVAAKEDCVFDLFFGTDYHSHLGTRRAGMAVYSKEEGYNRAIHNIENAPFRTKFDKDVNEMRGNLGIGCISDFEPQPLMVRSHHGTYAITTVGKINNTDAIIKDLFAKGHSHFLEMSGGDINEAVYDAVDVNGDGQVDIEDVILLAFKVPGVAVKRDVFLKQELMGKCSRENVDSVVEGRSLYEVIDTEKIDKIAKSIIQNERLKVSGISAALGTPGGAAMVATIPTDIAQYYGCLLRVAQKLMYLYGFSQIEYDLDGQCFDTETMNQIILCMGVMFGVANAKSGLLTLAKALGKGVEKKLINKALTKGTIYPIVKSVSKWFGVKMTKEVFAGFFKKAIPVVGGVIGGGLSYATFKPCCERLKNVLKDTYLSNPNYEENEEELEILDVAYESVE